MRLIPHIADLTVRLPSRQIPHDYPTTIGGAVQESGVRWMEMDLLDGLVRGKDSFGVIREMGVPEKAVALIVIRR